MDEPDELVTMTYRCKNNAAWSMVEIDKNCKVLTSTGRELILENDFIYSDFIAEDFRDDVWRAVQLAIQQHRPFTLKYPLVSAAGEKRIVFEQGQGEFDKQGRLLYLTGYVSDISHMIDTFFYASEEEQLACFCDEIIAIAEEKSGKSKIHGALSHKEILTLIYLCQGMTMKEIALKLNNSSRTIESYVKNLRSKLGCYNSCELRRLFFATSCGRKLVSKIEY